MIYGNKILDLGGTIVDVREVATAHVRALDSKVEPWQRFIIANDTAVGSMSSFGDKVFPPLLPLPPPPFMSVHRTVSSSFLGSSRISWPFLLTSPLGHSSLLPLSLLSCAALFLTRTRACALPAFMVDI